MGDISDLYDYDFAEDERNHSSRGRVVRCPYCKGIAEAVDGSVVYPHRSDLKSRKFFLCRPCEAWVGTHADGAPLGTLANAETRKARSAAHAAFDPLWRDNGIKRFRSRGHAYNWLSQEMKLKWGQECHIGHFNVEQCNEVVRICVSFRLRGSPSN